MKSELKAKFLQHLISKKRDGGFTLIELLVVIIIIGILSAIALPSFLNQANKGKQSEARQYIGTMVRQQQGFFAEQSKFASDFTELSNPIPTQTANYTYKVNAPVTGTNANVTMTAVSLTTLTGLKAYAGMAAQTTATTTGDANSVAIVCETKKPATAAPVPVAPTGVGQPTCDATSVPLGS